MNELFQKLIIPAKFMAEKTFNRKISASPELYAFAEKFAELIVRECVGVCDDERDLTDSDFGKLVAEGCAFKIMERFGVKE